jgi:hypothetical protein
MAQLHPLLDLVEVGVDDLSPAWQLGGQTARLTGRHETGNGVV